MAKHWPGGGSGEGGRDAHYDFGKYAVYPGDNFSDHLIPFIEGAFKLTGKIAMASAIMPYYTISYQQDTVYYENVGNAYSKYIISDLLRTRLNYDGVVCTDWRVVLDDGRCWGLEEGYSMAERHYKAIMAGVDQFGGINISGQVIEAYHIGIYQNGEDFIRQRFEESAIRILINMFRTGLFENPYLNIEEINNLIGKPYFMTAGYEAQLKSVVMLKNQENVLPIKREMKVYIPKMQDTLSDMLGSNQIIESTSYYANSDIVKKFLTVTDDPALADFALVFITSPISGTGYSESDIIRGGNGYVPISLQYKPYRAINARNPSIAGDFRSGIFANRTYQNKTVITSNASDLQLVLEARKAMGSKPVIVCVNVTNPMTFNEFEPLVDAILISFDVQQQAILEIITGIFEPSGLLPFQMPASMQTVEQQFEDVPHDMDCHTDTEGHIYDFAFGMNWRGVINDRRTSKYKLYNYNNLQ